MKPSKSVIGGEGGGTLPSSVFGWYFFRAVTLNTGCACKVPGSSKRKAFVPTCSLILNGPYQRGLSLSQGLSVASGVIPVRKSR